MRGKPLSPDDKKYICKNYPHYGRVRLGRDLGVSKQTIYNFVKSKEYTKVNKTIVEGQS